MVLEGIFINQAGKSREFSTVDSPAKSTGTNAPASNRESPHRKKLSVPTGSLARRFPKQPASIQSDSPVPQFKEIELGLVAKSIPRPEGIRAIRVAPLLSGGLAITPVPDTPLDEKGHSTEALEETRSGHYLFPLVSFGGREVRDKRIIFREGVSFVPIYLAAWLAQTTETTLRAWIKQRVKFSGWSLRTYTSPVSLETYVSAPSLAKAAERFVKWPSNKPAGAVILGETDDSSGYLGLPAAAREIGISNRTMWLWATQGQSPTKQQLDVIRCTTSDHFYIREKELSRLKLHRPNGFKRGPKSKSLSRT